MDTNDIEIRIHRFQDPPNQITMNEPQKEIKSTSWVQDESVTQLFEDIASDNFQTGRSLSSIQNDGNIDLYSIYYITAFLIVCIILRLNCVYCRKSTKY